MKKNIYISPKLVVVELNGKDAILMSGSLNGNTVIQNGGSAQENGITSADVKGQGTSGVWDDIWE